MLSDSGKSGESSETRREVARKISPGWLVYSLTKVDRALNGLAKPFVREKILVFTSVGKSLPLA